MSRGDAGIVEGDALKTRLPNVELAPSKAGCSHEITRDTLSKMTTIVLPISTVREIERSTSRDICDLDPLASCFLGTQADVFGVGIDDAEATAQADAGNEIESHYTLPRL